MFKLKQNYIVVWNAGTYRESNWVSLLLRGIANNCARLPIVGGVGFRIGTNRLAKLVKLGKTNGDAAVGRVVNLVVPFDKGVTVSNQALHRSARQCHRSFTFVPRAPILCRRLALERRLRVATVTCKVARTITVRGTVHCVQSFHLRSGLS